MRETRAEKKLYVALAFGNTRDAMAAESVVRASGVPIKVMSLPPHRGELCAISLRLSPHDEDRVLEALRTHEIAVKARDEIEDF